MSKLTAIFVKNAGPGKYEDGNGLRLVKRPDGGGQWIYRYMLNGRRREMGIGGLSKIGLKDAREIAAKYRKQVALGEDPITMRQKERAEATANLLNDIASDAFESRKAELKGDGKAGRWFSPLELHVLPTLGKMDVRDITQRDVRRALEPIWHEKAATAKKAADRLKLVIDHAAALGLDVDLQAVAKAKKLLGRQRHEVKHIPSMAWQDVPAFYQSLSGGSMSELALRLLILTGVRSGPVRLLRLDEIDDDVWTVPAANMKARVGAATDFRVPLSKEALDVIEQAAPLSRDGFLFPGTKRGVISDMTLTALMRRRDLEERPHGFRTSLRTWLAECTDAPHEVAEACLAHVTDSKVVRTYRQTDFLDQRRVLLDRWARHCEGTEADVVRIAG